MEYERLVTLAIPTKGYVDTKFMKHMLKVMYKLTTGASIRFRVTNRDPETGAIMPVAQAREKLVADILREDRAKYVFFVDSDIFVPLNGFQYLLQSAKDIVTGVSWTKADPPQPTIYKRIELGPYFDFPRNYLFEVAAAGLACSLIRTKVFKKVPRPWFIAAENEILEEYGLGTKMGEDFYFFLKARKYGFKLWCNSNVRCEHLKEQPPQKFYPGEWMKIK